MGRTQHVLLCTVCLCMATLLPSLTYADDRPSDQPNTVFLPMTLQSPGGPAVSANPAPPTPTASATPTMPTPAPAPEPPGVTLTPLEAEVVRLTNEYRTQHGCPALNVSPELTAAARAHSQDMADKNYFDHKGSDGSQPWDRMKNAGYTWMMAGENILAGTSVAQDVVNSWISDSDHLANILTCGYKDIGVGFVDDTTDVYPSASRPYRYYWTQDFGARP